MRISTTQIYTQGLRAFGTQQTKLAHLQEQISTGTRITKPSDDPAASARVLELEQIKELNEQYQVNIDLAEQRLKLQDTTLDSVGNVLTRLKELVIQSNNAPMDVVSREAIATEIDQRLEQLLALGNTIDANGDYLFAGYQNEVQPFSQTLTGSISHVMFNGDQGKRSIQISQSRQMDVDTNGDQLFMRIPSTAALNVTTNAANTGSGVMAPAHVFDQTAYVAGDYQIVFTGANTYDVVDLSGPVNIVTGATYVHGDPIDFQGIRTSITGTPAVGDSFTVSSGQYQDMFSMVNSITETLRSASSSDQRAVNFAQSLSDLDAAINHLLEARTRIGGRLNALESQYQDNEAYIVATQETVGVMRDTDLAEAISQMTLEQTTLDAAQAVFARITSSSLFNFLR
jgi:flagellar hook-associated protein 3 FlgL